MTKDQSYGGLIWTHHALERIGHRGLSQYYVSETVQKPDSAHPGKQSGTKEYKKNYKQSTVTVITSKSENGQIIVLSCWVDPPIYGSTEWKEKQYAVEYKKAGSWWKKLWIILKKQFGV